MAGKARASAVTRRAKRRARPGLQEAIRYSATLSASVWLGALKQTVGSKIVAGVGGESLPKAPEGSVLHAADKQLYFIGAVGQSALGRSSAKAVPAGKAGAFLYACDQLWKEAKFNNANPKHYGRLYHLTQVKKGTGGVALWWCFSSVVLLCEEAKNRRTVIPALTGVVCLFAVVLAGNAFLTVGSECTVWKEGTGNVFCPTSPDTPLRVEVEGSTSLVLAYMVESDVGHGAPQAKKRAACFVKARIAAKQEWDRLLKNHRTSCKRLRREAGLEQAGLEQQAKKEPPEPEQADPGASPGAADTTML